MIKIHFEKVTNFADYLLNFQNLKLSHVLTVLEVDVEDRKTNGVVVFIAMQVT